MYRPDLARLLATLAIGTLAGTVAATLAAQQPREDRSGHDPARSCFRACHGPGLIAQQRLDRAGWARVVDKMIRWGAEVPDGKREALVDELARTFRASRPLPASNRYLPEHAGADLVRRACLSCHDDSLLTRQRLDRAGWQRVVAQMIAWGAAVPAAQTGALLDSLEAQFGRAPDRAP